MPSSRSRALVLLGAFVVYAPFLGLGYGFDGDGFGAVAVARTLLDGGDYWPSRNPGSPLHEVSSIPALWLGAGPWLTNLFTLALALSTLHAVMALVEEAGGERPWLAGLLVALHPVFAANATLTMDYVWGLGLLTPGLLMLVRGRTLAAGALLGLAVAARFTSMLPAAAFGAVAFLERPERRRALLASAAIAASIVVVAYWPAFAFHGYSAKFLKAQYEPWSAKGHAMRLVYRSVYFWGPFATAVLAWIGVAIWRRRAWRAENSTGARRLVLHGSLAATALGALMFARYPLESAYLLVILPAVVVALALMDFGERRLAWPLAAALALYAVVNVNVAKVAQRGSDRPQVGLWVERGYLAQVVHDRLLFRDARTFEDWLRINEVLEQELERERAGG